MKTAAIKTAKNTKAPKMTARETAAEAAAVVMLNESLEPKDEISDSTRNNFPTESPLTVFLTGPYPSEGEHDPHFVLEVAETFQNDLPKHLYSIYSLEKAQALALKIARDQRLPLWQDIKWPAKTTQKAAMPLDK